MSRTLSRRALVVLVTACTSAHVHAGVIRHDRSDNPYRGMGSARNDVGWVSYGLSFGSATLISPRWVLTAGHVVDDQVQHTFHIGGGGTMSTTANYPVTSFTAHPNWNANAILGGSDIGVIRLTGNGVTDIAPASRFTGHDEVGRTVTSVGFGLWGEADDPARTLDGRRRGGNNVVDAAGVSAYGAGTNADILAADFDDPGDVDGKNSFTVVGGSNLPLDFEYCVAGGDSGGGMFVVQSAGVVTREFVAGVHSFVEAPDPPNGDNVDDSGYSDTYGSTRVSSFNAWIDDQITNKWNPTTSGTFATAGNWSFNAVPDQYEVVGLTRPNTYTITFGANAVNDRLITRAGNVTLNLSTRTYTLQSQTFEGSLIVGRYAGETAALTVTGGVFTTREAVLAEQPGSTGQLTIGSGGTWNAVGDVYAGGNFIAPGGTGAIVLNSGSSTTFTGNLKLYGGGSLNLSGGSFSAASVDLAGGTLAGLVTSTLSTPINASVGGTLRADAPLNLTGPITTADNATIAKTGPAVLAISGSQTHGANTTLTVSAGTLNLNSSATGGTLAVNANATTNFGASQHLRALNVATGVTASVTTGANKNVKTAALSVAGTGKLDLKDNALVVDYTGASVEPQVRQLLATGYHGGDWLGSGVMTSSAGSSGLFALASGEASGVLGLTGGATQLWRGQTVDATSVLARFTYAGDANLDGLVSGDDYSGIDFSILTPGSTGYWRGDFNYDGVISGDDYSTIDFTILAQGAPLGAGDIAGVTVVPEPSATIACVIAGASLLTRRRRIR